MTNVVHLVVCAAPPARHVDALIVAMHDRGWRVCVIATPTAMSWMDTDRLATLTEHPVRCGIGHPDQQDPLPDAAAVVVAPATFNTINAWAAGINDTLALGVLNESLGRTRPVIALPHVNPALAEHPAYRRSLGLLRDAGVQVIDTDAECPGGCDGSVHWPSVTAALDHRRRAAAMVVLRSERMEDAHAVAAAHVAAWRAGYAGTLPGDLLDGLDVEEWARRRRQYLADPDTDTLVASLNGTVVGHVTYGRCRGEPDLPVGEIWACYVHPDQWGTGVGDRLLTAALVALPDREVRVWVLEANHRARRFYQRHGFHADGARDLYRPAGTTVGVPEVRHTLRRV